MLRPTSLPRRLSPLLSVAFAALAVGCKGSPSGDPSARLPSGTQSAPFESMVRDAGAGDSGMVYRHAIPDDFPGTVRLYPGGRVTLGGAQTMASGKRSWSLTVETPDPRDRVLAFYGTNLPGFEPASSIDVGDSYLAVWRSPALDLDLLVGQGADGKTTVTLDVEER